MDNLSDIRSAMRAAHLGGEAPVLEALIADAAISDTIRQRTRERAIALIEEVRNQDRPGLMEVFLAEYGLSTDEGVALMCLAEALLRVPDADTIDALIEDKIAPSDWSNHLGQAASPLVNASTWALMLTGKVLREGEGAGIAAMLRGAIRRVGEPVIRAAVARSMEELGQQFVLGRDMAEALRNAAGPEGQGFTYSYDMLGEAGLTEADARAYFEAYAQAISALAPHSTAPDTRDNPGISVKLSALHPRYEATQHRRIMTELVPRLSDLARRARAANMGFTIDAEEADRLDLSLDVIEAVVADPRLAG
jgi:RHH-type proline utilization regulon transcriptional repressor/proline dehydrogenase/delta 1-pyrroline-5-carboxylate dehydrogenase